MDEVIYFTFEGRIEMNTPVKNGCVVVLSTVSCDIVHFYKGGELVGVGRRPPKGFLASIIVGVLLASGVAALITYIQI